MTEEQDQKVEALAAKIRDVAVTRHFEKKRLQEEFEEVIAALIRQACDLPVDDRRWIFQALYWDLPPEMFKRMLVPLTGLPHIQSKGIEEWHGGGPNAFPCTECGKPLRRDNGQTREICIDCEYKLALTDPTRLKELEERKRVLDRVTRLRQLPYWEYLQTDHWQKVRATCLKRFHGRCQICNSDNCVQVHHRTYENRGYENVRDVIALCADCHEIFHRAGKLAIVPKEPPPG